MWRKKRIHPSLFRGFEKRETLERSLQALAKLCVIMFSLLVMPTMRFVPSAQTASASNPDSLAILKKGSRSVEPMEEAAFDDTRY